jgi:uncharacterized membrane-anchored protein YhcB (DUF1043 family)
MGEFIYLIIGFAFGCVIMLNRKEYREQKTYEELDEQLRKELATYKNLSESLKADLRWAKQRIEALKEKK